MSLMIGTIGVIVASLLILIITAVVWAQELSDEERERIGHGSKNQGRNW